ncbi:hypothetical protein SpCBS45565_g07468 [Spizellomyces sp. 'palustris']|nr:hypothetical protein SpCBS45565_g07468 [Spizellomyces sp. 'palustris']
MNFYPPIPTSQSPLKLVLRPTLQRQCLVIGGSRLAAAIARSVLAANAVVTLVSQRLCKELAVRSARGEVGWLERQFEERDLIGKDLVFVVDEDPTWVVESCRQSRIWVSAVRHPDLGDFSISHEPVCEQDDTPVLLEPSLRQTPSRTPSPAPPRLPGTLTLVGAGPGSPDLLTLKALTALKTADLVVSDRLVSPAITRLVTCPIQFARKVCGRAREAQDEIYKWTLNAVKEGKNVVRLKGGDPFVFGRGGEEVLFFRKCGVECVVVPGISSSLAAPLYAGIPVTHRGVADQVVIATGRKEDGSAPTYPPYHPQRTSVFLMAMGCIDRLSKTLVKDLGYPPECPVAVIEKATCEEQRVVKGTVESIAGLVSGLGITSHATLVVGGVVEALAPEEDEWSDERSSVTVDLDVDDTWSSATVVND